MDQRTSVLVVDDSALVRKLLSHLLDSHPTIDVIGTAIDAKDARQKIKALNPDVLTLDIEMPGMDGLTFLSKVMTLRPMPVVMVSTLTERGADASLQAMQLGAFDVFAKPKEDLAKSLDAYKDTLHNKVLSAAQANIAVLAARARRQVEVQASAPSNQAVETIPNIPHASGGVPPIIAIGSSTGGTEAVRQILERLPANVPGIVIAQHIPESFSASFADRLNACSLLSVKEAEDGDRIVPGSAFVAPGGRHLTVVKQGGHYQCALNDAEPVNRHKPSVDVLFDSVATHASKKALGIILTGMGKDGAQGLLNMRDQGAHTIAQDEATSVVWGMPGSAVKINAAKDVLPIGDIPKHLAQRIARLI